MITIARFQGQQLSAHYVYYLIYSFAGSLTRSQVPYVHLDAFQRVIVTVILCDRIAPIPLRDWEQSSMPSLVFCTDLQHAYSRPYWLNFRVGRQFIIFDR